MSPTTIGVLGILVLVLLFLVRIPVAFSMAAVGILGFSYVVSLRAGLEILAMDIFETFSSYDLTVIPMFVLMGSIAYRIGITTRLFDASYTFFGKMRGGLAVASIIACAGFAAICGSTTATAASMGSVALPQMKRYKYDDAFATGCVASAGSLGILIPPSGVLIVYGIIAQQSIGKLFIAGVLPGILLSLLFVMTVMAMCWRNRALGPAGAATTLKEKIRTLPGIVEVPILFILVLGGLFTGWFSPTQAGGAGSASVLLLGLVRRKVTWKIFCEAAKDTLLISCMVVFIVTGATIFSHFLAVTKIPFLLSNWVNSLSFPAIIIMSIVIFIHLIGGCFMDGFALILLTVPILLPVLEKIGFDLIWFGVIIVLICEMGAITPPVGVNVYVIKGVAEDVPLETIFKGIFPFLAALIVEAVLLMLFPRIVTFLPGLVSY
jgi:C4-dicarboxylate transporter DctM subunit